MNVKEQALGSIKQYAGPAEALREDPIVLEFEDLTRQIARREVDPGRVIFTRKGSNVDELERRLMKSIESEEDLYFADNDKGSGRRAIDDLIKDARKKGHPIVEFHAHIFSEDPAGEKLWLVTAVKPIPKAGASESNS